jgi:phage protein U
MYYQLGENIIFEALIGPNSFTQDEPENYAQHDTINSTPRLQKIGTGLRTINLVIKFNSSFCTPEDQLNIIRSAKKEGEVLAFIDGNGLFIGDFVITKLNFSVNKTDSKGAIRDTDATIELLEFFDPNNTNTPAGYANSSEDPQTEPVAVHNSETLLLTNEVTVLGNEAGVCDTQLTAAEADSTETAVRLSNVGKSTNKMSQSVDRLEVACDGDSVASSAASLKAYLGDVRTSITNLKTIAGLGSITDTRSALANLQLVFANVRTLSAGTIVLYATRRG